MEMILYTELQPMGAKMHFKYKTAKFRVEINSLPWHEFVEFVIPN